MNLTMGTGGAVAGTYHSQVGGPMTSPIVGKANGDQIVFFVDWMPGSMTTWAGQLLTTASSAEVLETVWLNTRDVSQSDEPHSGWSGIRTGGDLFTRVS